MATIKLTEQLTLNLGVTSSNLLIVGPTGSDKTFLLCHSIRILISVKKVFLKPHFAK